ncbi:FtsX-like permease family protein [Cognatiyoonia sp. IB215446]|uniref:cell division protein FtsX n=1 Tax=Cognatiyoonia sp. IB215446 TaxID=3097355 RepID=UPI002A182CA0|nr:FtsX-like permease family protein [Cognatiyoonia sp. IB215446]MDX8350024.1 FtsX-like permease family protein [Cognatiyoonia sp. IB215446]
MSAVLDLIVGDRQADRVVPPTGLTARLTVFAAAVMAFLAVIALALSLSAGRVADRWAQDLAQSATLRLPADPELADVLLIEALEVLQTTPGVASARALSADEQQALLEPWFGPDLPIDTLPVPQLIEVIATDEGYDAAGLRARLNGQVPGAVLDDHSASRAPLLQAASRVRSLGWLIVLLIGGVVAAIISLAAQASLNANAQVIRVLRAVGARDVYIARAFVRRFTLRAGLGATGGVLLGLIAISLLPDSEDVGGLMTNIGFQGFGWLWPLVIPPLSAIVAFIATRAAAFARLREQI